MADPRFYAVAGPFTLSKLAEIACAEIGGDADPDARYVDVEALHSAGPEHVSFLDNRRYAATFAESRSGACLVRPELAATAPRGMALLLTPDPYLGYARIARAFYPPPPLDPAVAPSASIDGTAQLGDGSRVDAGAVVGPRAEIGRRCRIGANAVIGTGVVVGDDCDVGSSATLAYCVVGRGVIIHPGVRIGQDGFGFVLGSSGHVKVPQVGRVVIEDGVEIGANSTVDRGTGPDTVIGAGTKIDNLVQIAHNVRLGRGCVVVSQVGISGSTAVGDLVMMGGQAGLAGHLSIGAGARVAAQSGVIRDVEPGATVAGSPAIPARQHWRQVATVASLARKGKKLGD